MSERGEPHASLGYRKRFYRVGEVCEMAGLEPHVLRYWEQEFTALRPRKSRGGQRLYTPEDVELVLRIRDLLHVQGHTIAGARRRLAAQRRGEVPGEPDSVELLDLARGEIASILTMLEANDKL